MIRFGCCAPVRASALLADAGFDFIELSSDILLPEEPAEAFEPVRQNLAAQDLFPEVLSLVLPPQASLIGPDLDRGHIERLLRCTFERAGAVGARLVVFGAGARRDLPADLPRPSAWRQLKRLLDRAAKLASAQGLELAVEPIPGSGSSMIDSLEEAWILAEEVAQPNVGVAAPLAYLLAEREGYDALIVAGSALRHVYVSDPDRRPPGESAFSYRPLFDALAQANYQGSVSIASDWRSLQTQAPHALQTLREAARLAP